MNSNELFSSESNDANKEINDKINKIGAMNYDPGDTETKKSDQKMTQQTMVKETSASTVGPMLPQTPLTENQNEKGMIKKMNIPDVIVEFTYNPDSVYDEIVESAVSDFANDMKVNFIPFKLRKMIIERAVLRVKIAWCSKMKGKENKVRTYKKRYREVDSAISRVQKAVTNDSEKRKMQKAIDEIDKEVTKKTRAKINQKEIVESTNSLITAMQESGIIPTDFPLIDTNVFTEGANFDMIRTGMKYDKLIRGHMKAARALIKTEEYDDASKEVEKASEIVSEYREALREIPKDKLSTKIIGSIIGSIIFTIFSGVGLLIASPLLGIGDNFTLNPKKCLLKLKTDPSVPKLVGLSTAINVTSHIIEVWEENKKTGDDESAANILYNLIIQGLHSTEKVLDDISAKIKKKKAKAESSNETLKTESVFDSSILIYNEMTDCFELVDDKNLDMFESGNNDDIFSEGANIDLYKEMILTKKEYTNIIKNMKNAIKAEEYKKAADYAKDASKIIADYRAAIRKYPKDDLNVNFIGTILGLLVFYIKSTLIGIGFGAVITLPALGGTIALQKSIKKAAKSMEPATGGFPNPSKLAVKAARAGYSISYASSILFSIGVSMLTLFKVIQGLNANLKEQKKTKSGVDINIVNISYNKALVVAEKLEKELDKLTSELKKLTKEEVKKESVDMDSFFERYREITNVYESEMIDDMALIEFFTEAKKPDDGMMDILQTLNRKGYKTKYSCSGHKSSFKEDRDDNGVINGKLTSGARIMFMDDYEFPDPPKHWGWKTVDGKDYLYVISKYHNADRVDVDKAFDAWKNKYMGTLKRWVDELPDQNDNVIKKPNPKKEEDIAESAWDEIDDLINEDLYESISSELDDELTMLLL